VRSRDIQRSRVCDHGAVRGPATSSIDAVVFDCDGLLLDTEDAWMRGEVTLYARDGVTFDMRHKRELLGTAGAVAHATLERHLARPGEGAALYAELVGLVLEEIERDAPVRPGASALVAALRRAGVPVGLASNSPRVVLDRAVACSGFAGVFDAVISAEEVASPKPAPDIYVEACRRLGAEPSRAVGLEDSPTGVAAAKAAGLFVIGVPSLPGVALDDADLVVASLAAPDVWASVGLRRAA
jgi:HAD superfamily hydrolase (TIGR01509 family)